MHLTICKVTLFTKNFEKFFDEILFWRTVCTISLFYLKHFGFPGKRMALREDRLTANFLQMSIFCTETQFHLINCLLLEKNDLQKTLKKSPVGHLAHWGFFWPLIPNLFCVRHFALIKNSRRITERQPYFVLTWRAVKKNIVPNKKTTKKTTFFALFWKFWPQLDYSFICEFQVFCYITVSCIWRFVKLLFSQKFSKNFSMRSFFEELFALCHCFISNILAFQENK